MTVNLNCRFGTKTSEDSYRVYLWNAADLSTGVAISDLNKFGSKEGQYSVINHFIVRVGDVVGIWLSKGPAQNATITAIKIPDSNLPRPAAPLLNVIWWNGDTQTGISVESIDRKL